MANTCRRLWSEDQLGQGGGGGGEQKLYKQTVIIAPDMVDLHCVIYTHKATALTANEVYGSVANYIKNVVKIFYFVPATEYESFYYESQMYFDEGGNNRGLYPCNYNGSQTQPSYGWQDWMDMTVQSIEEI